MWDAEKLPQHGAECAPTAEPTGPEATVPALGVSTQDGAGTPLNATPGASLTQGQRLLRSALVVRSRGRWSPFNPLPV